ncbi:MAG: signal peptidase I [Methylophagaceae bacterium]
MSFPALMVSLVVVTGLIWLVDKIMWSDKRSPSQPDPMIVEYAKSFFPIILVVLVIRSFLYEPFRIPSASMVPTLHIGDFILVNKHSYGIRLPVVNIKLINVSKPERGDVVVFRYPPQPEVDYIKRVVGLPGDHVKYSNKMLYINGEVMKQSLLKKNSELFGVVPINNKVLSEQLGDKSHEIALAPRRQRVMIDEIIPEGEYFVMGDNRDNSSDSRFWGTVPEGNLVGKAFYIWMSWDCNASWSCIGWKRLGGLIH